MQFRIIKSSKLKEKLSKFIYKKFGVNLPPDKMIPVLHRSCVEQRVYCQDDRGAHYESDYTLSNLWKHRNTMTIENRQLIVDDRYT